MSSSSTQSTFNSSFPQRSNQINSIGNNNLSNNSSLQTNYERLFYSDTARQYFLDASPNILICGPPRSGKTSIIDVMFYKASPHETLSYLPSNGSCVHSINHTPLFRCTIIDLVSTITSSGTYPSLNFHTNNNEINVLNLPYFSSHSSTSIFISPEHSYKTFDSVSYLAQKNENKVLSESLKCLNSESLFSNSAKLNRNNNDTSHNLDLSFDELLFNKIASIIFVIDAQNDPLGYDLTQAKDIFKRAWKYNPDVKFEVFIHKVDGDIFATDEVRSECQRAIHDKLMTFLDEEKVKNANVMFYSTSIYDHTIFEAFSRVMQNLTKNLSAYSQLLDTLVAKCKMERAFLMDSHTKAFIATDSSSFDPFNYELCSEMIDVMVELSSIYGSKNSSDIISETDSKSINIKDKNEKIQEIQLIEKIPENLLTKRPPPSCLISLTSGHILYLKEIDKFVALASTIREDNFDRQYLIDYNIKVFKEALNRIIQLSI